MVLRELHRTAQRENHFTRTSIWRGFLLNTDEKRRIDRLMGSALLDDTLCDLLVNKRDASVMASFGLSLETQDWLQNIQAGSLEELAQEIALVA
ncbi:MAG: hypothetical protein IT319_10150 [Anaerolineae bacterium]|nr:hypothetical protein [Anaerolineae bacterium]